MKYALIICALVGLFVNQEGQAATCPKFLSCESFKMESKSEDGQVSTFKIVISPKDDLHAKIQFIGMRDGSQSELALDLSFQPDGTFAAEIYGRTGGVGICGQNLCSFALEPMQDERGPYAITGVLRFLGDKLEYNKFAAAPEGQYKYSYVYEKE